MKPSTTRILKFIRNHPRTNWGQIALKFYNGDIYLASIALNKLRQYITCMYANATIDKETELGPSLIPIRVPYDIYLNINGEDYLRERRWAPIKFLFPIVVSLLVALIPKFCAS